MSRPLWHEQRVGALGLLDGICLPLTATLWEALQHSKKFSEVPAIAVVGEEQRVLGVVAIGSVLSAIDQFGQHESLKSLSYQFNSDCIVHEFDLLGAVVERLPKIKHSFVVVCENKKFQGFLPLNKVLTHVVQNSSHEDSRPATEVSAVANQFVSYVAHDLRNPLCVVSAVSGLIADVSDCDEQMKKYTDLILRASKQALQISDGLVQMERYAQAGQIFSQKTNLSQFMNEIQADNCELVRYRGNNLIVDECEDRTVMLDSYLIKRAILNLIDNACKHSPAKGKIHISAKCLQRNDKDCVEFSVRDEGNCLNQASGQKIFEPFMQLETDKKALGFGLGLTIAKRFSEFHGGSIRVERLEGLGTAFTLSIPNCHT